MGAKKSLNAEEVESLTNLSEIEYVYQKKYVKDNKLELNISVMPLESKLIEITYEWWFECFFFDVLFPLIDY